MTVLVMGASGFLGRAVLHRLQASGLSVIAVARSSAAGGEAADLGDPAQVVGLLSRHRPLAVVNCAATVDFGAGTLARQYPVNCLLPAVVAEWCARCGAFLVQPSSVVVHGIACERVGPGMALAADTDYGRSKVLAEEIISASGCAAAVLRFGGLFGKGGPDHLGLNRAIRAAHAGQAPTVVGDGLARRNYLFVDDAAAMIEHCLRQRLTGTFFAGGREILNIREMFTILCDVLLPGRQPCRVMGNAARDQIIEVSPELPAGRTFQEAIEEER